MPLVINKYEQEILVLLHIVEVIINWYAVVLSSGKSEVNFYLTLNFRFS